MDKPYKQRKKTYWYLTSADAARTPDSVADASIGESEGNQMATIKGLSFGERHCFTEATAEEVIAKIEHLDLYGRGWFIVNGKPYNEARKVELDENENYILFKYSSRAFIRNTASKYWDGNYDKAKAHFNIDNVVGYEFVDVYYNGYYVGAKINVILKT